MSTDHDAAASRSEYRAPVPLDDRIDPPFLAGDRSSLESWVELYRATLPLKIGGLTGEELCRPSVPPSNLTLLGLVRHLTFVEAYWFRRVVAGGDGALPYEDTDQPDADLLDLDPTRAVEDIDRYEATLDESRRLAAAIDDLDAPVAGRRHGEELNLRWVYTHLIEEYARHLGHADLLREAIDGATGY